MHEYDLEIARLAGQGLCCAQILMQLGLMQHGGENPALVRSLGGLCNGLGVSGTTCGVLTGGACLLAYFAGKDAYGQGGHARLPLMISELADWFTEETVPSFGGIACSDIVADGKPDTRVCASLLGKTYARVLELLLENGLDPHEGPLCP